MHTFDKSLFTYTPLFCEENIWKLIEAIQEEIKIRTADVLFIINRNNTVAIFEQIKSIGQQPVIWDYHVILTAYIDQKPYVFDFDSRCQFPCEIDRYFLATFPQNIVLQESYMPEIRRINAEHFFNHFSSDRSHMRGIISESEFPDYEPIQSTHIKQQVPLDMYRNIECTIADSEILTPISYIKKISSYCDN